MSRQSHDTGGCLAAPYSPYDPAHFSSTAGNLDQGIVVGTGDTAFDGNQSNLISLISEGTSSGKLSYQAQTAPTTTYASGTKTWTATQTRKMNNNSGASIIVKESGLMNGYYTFYRNAATIGFLVERSVLSPTVTVPDGAQLTVTYTISMDFSAID